MTKNAYGIARFQRGDSVILRHPIGSCHCSVPPPRSAHQSSCCVSSAAWSFSCDENHHTHTHRYLFHAACVISALPFGPQGEEPVVDSTLHREGAVHGGLWQRGGNCSDEGQLVSSGLAWACTRGGRGGGEEDRRATKPIT
ncbi:hypothetical protein fugu_017745 [Takifugu bimaculatus]|uniref:Uncharacterized protein n=1 Tax=Takifugu bimaculatus TaxID=433685 RepID=A0A4Z2BTS2_9TELE|nr:hypothetical protein fugu_017745 [Takifugu bimaculatus]